MAATVETRGVVSPLVTWSSSQSAVASVSDDGTVTANSPGTAVVTATSGSDPTKSGSSTVTVIHAPGSEVWSLEFGKLGKNSGRAVVTDAAGNIYVTGLTFSAQGLAASLDPNGIDVVTSDVFIRKYNANGIEQWTRHFGTDDTDEPAGIAIDGAGNILVTGHTFGAFEGLNGGDVDVFVSKHDPSGVNVWTRQFGTQEDDMGNAVTTDSFGNVFVTGFTRGALQGVSYGLSDIFLRKLDPSGTETWTRQYGTYDDDIATGLVSDAYGNVVVSGYTEGDLHGPSFGASDAVLVKFLADGRLAWGRQFGTNDYDLATGLASDPLGNTYVTGLTYSSMTGGTNLGDGDSFLRKVDGNGEHIWTQQFGTGFTDIGTAVTVDSLGNVIVVGDTKGSIAASNQGGLDTYVRKYAANGSETWTRQVGTPADDSAAGVTTDSEGNVVIVGSTDDFSTVFVLKLRP